MYKYYQPNKKDLKDNFGDCVIRSMCLVSDKNWIDVFDELVEIARYEQCMPNSKAAYQTWLKNNGFTYTGISNKKGSKRPTVSSFAKGNKELTCVLVVANHLVGVKCGNYYDTWDSGNKSLYGYWSKG